MFAVCRACVVTLWLGLAGWPFFADGAPIEDNRLPNVLSAAESSPHVNPPDEAQVSNPELAEARRSYAAGDLQRCLELLRAAVAQDPRLPDPMIMLADFHLTAREHGLARRVLEECAKTDPSEPQLHVAFGQLALSEQRFSDASVHFEKALAAEVPDHWESSQRQKLKTVCYAGLVAVAEYREHWWQAQVLLKKLVQLNPQSGAFRNNWARALFMAGQLDKAYEQFDIAYRQDASVNPPEISMGVRNVLANNFEQANAWYEAALAKYPDNSAVHYEYSMALLVQDRASEAEQAADRAAELGMQTPALEIHRAQIARRQKDYPRAKLVLERILNQQPDNAHAKALLSRVLDESAAD